jgi:hypothetical protein
MGGGVAGDTDEGVVCFKCPFILVNIDCNSVGDDTVFVTGGWAVTGDVCVATGFGNCTGLDTGITGD